MGVRDSTIGIVGMGRIGTSVASKLQTFHPKRIIFHDVKYDRERKYYRISENFQDYKIILAYFVQIPFSWLSIHTMVSKNVVTVRRVAKHVRFSTFLQVHTTFNVNNCRIIGKRA